MIFDKSWTLFLDRDGVINRRIVGGYVTRWEDFEFLPGVLEALPRLARVFGKIIVVSNQQGVGKGIMTTADVDRIHSSMIRQVEGAGGRIDLVLYSPHLSSEASGFRKPATGMAMEAQRRFPSILLERSVMAGDMESDLRFGRNAGMKTILLSDDPALVQALEPLYDKHYYDLKSFSDSMID